MTSINLNNKSVENFIYTQTEQYNVSAVDYLTTLVLNEMEYISVKKDINQVNNEIKQVNQGTLKLQTLDSLINELDD